MSGRGCLIPGPTAPYLLIALAALNMLATPMLVAFLIVFMSGMRRIKLFIKKSFPLI